MGKRKNKWPQFVRDFRAALELDLREYYVRCENFPEHYRYYRRQRWLPDCTESPDFEDFVLLLQEASWFADIVYETCKGKIKSAHKHLAGDRIRIQVDSATFDVRSHPGVLAQLYKRADRRFPKLLHP